MATYFYRQLIMGNQQVGIPEEPVSQNTGKLGYRVVAQRGGFPEFGGQEEEESWDEEKKKRGGLDITLN